MKLPVMTSRIADMLEQSRPKVGDVVSTFDVERFVVERWLDKMPYAAPIAGKTIPPIQGTETGVSA